MDTESTQEADVGINLSSDVYDIDGESQENAVWVNGQVHLLRGVKFSIPIDTVRDQWAIRSSADMYGVLFVFLSCDGK